MSIRFLILIDFTTTKNPIISSSSCLFQLQQHFIHRTIMSSTILYKFRSGQTFESLALPGSAARLFDVKKAIVKAKKLDQGGQLEFDLQVRDANTDQEYVDESMVLPRGTRVVVQRLPAARGHGFLARMARADAGMAGAISNNTTAAQAVPSGFYTIQGGANDDDEEFVSTAAAATQGEDEKELAAMMAVTGQDPSTAVGSVRGPTLSTTSRVAGSGPPPPRPTSHFHTGGGNRPQRPNADPELRDAMMPKKRTTTGIPRTFLNLNAPPVTDGSTGEVQETKRLQPNAIGFEELVNRGGGQSERIAGTKRDLDYALKLTSTEIPEHLQCGICHKVVKNAMLLPWDTEGRTACETCIRDALTSSGFTCPLTGMEGVSPDDLHPNHGLRKAAEAFIKEVMEKVDEIDRQEVDELDTEETDAAAVNLEGESGDKGVIVSRKTMKDHKRKNEDDPFGGGDDDFGGDVFDVAPDEADGEDDEGKDGDDKPTEEEPVPEAATDASDAKPVETTVKETTGLDPEATDENRKMNKPSQSEDAHSKDQSPSSKGHDGSPRDAPMENKRAEKRRGPPAGYAMGPAGGAAVRGARKSPEVDRPVASPMNGRGAGSPYGRGRGGRGEFFGRGGRGGRFHGGRYDDDFGRGRGRSGRGGYHDEVSRFRLLVDCVLIPVCTFLVELGRDFLCTALLFIVDIDWQ